MHSRKLLSVRKIELPKILIRPDGLGPGWTRILGFYGLPAVDLTLPGLSGSLGHPMLPRSYPKFWTTRLFAFPRFSRHSNFSNIIFDQLTRLQLLLTRNINSRILLGEVYIIRTLFIASRQTNSGVTGKCRLSR